MPSHCYHHNCRVDKLRISAHTHTYILCTVIEKQQQHKTTAHTNKATREKNSNTSQIKYRLNISTALMPSHGNQPSLYQLVLRFISVTLSSSSVAVRNSFPWHFNFSLPRCLGGASPFFLFCRLFYLFYWQMVNLFVQIANAMRRLCLCVCASIRGDPRQKGSQ